MQGEGETAQAQAPRAFLTIRANPGRKIGVPRGNARISVAKLWDMRGNADKGSKQGRENQPGWRKFERNKPASSTMAGEPWEERGKALDRRTIFRVNSGVSATDARGVIMAFRRADLQEAFFVPGTHAFRV